MENNEGRQWEKNYLSNGLMTIEHVRSYTRSQMPRMRWTPELHNRFLRAIQQLGGEYWATPKMILDCMNVEGINLNQIKSHLQRYRNTKNEETTQGAKAQRTLRDSGNSLTIGGNRVSDHQTQRSSVNNIVFGYPYEGNYGFHHDITPVGASNPLAPGMERGEGSNSWTSTYGSTEQPSIIISDLLHGSSNMENGNQRDEGKKSEVINIDDDDEVTEKLDGEVDSSLGFSSFSETYKRMKLKDDKVECSINLSLSLGPPGN